METVDKSGVSFLAPLLCLVLVASGRLVAVSPLPGLKLLPSTYCRGCTLCRVFLVIKELPIFTLVEYMNRNLA